MIASTVSLDGSTAACNRSRVNTAVSQVYDENKELETVYKGETFTQVRGLASLSAAEPR